MIIVQAKMRCNHCERYQETEVELEPCAYVGGFKVNYVDSGPPQGWMRLGNGYVVCVKCLEIDKEPI